MNICKAISCPYNDLKNGCQRWSLSDFCHLKRSHCEWESNQYWLFTQESWLNNEIQLIKNENDAFFREDPKYQDDLNFQQEFPELFSERSFRVRSIS